MGSALPRLAVFAALALSSVSALGVPAEARSIVPIALDSCTLRTSLDGTNTILGENLVYRNLSSMPATRVVFDVRYGGRTERVTDAGTFSQNARIEHQLGAFSGTTFDAAQPTGCTVHSVTFANGRTYVYDFVRRFTLRIDRDD